MFIIQNFSIKHAAATTTTMLDTVTQKTTPAVADKMCVATKHNFDGHV
jgi:hypothetical protein